MANIETNVSEVLLVPRRGEPPILLELKLTQEAISRLSDIAVVNSAILPDLLSVFGKSLAELNRAMGVISLELVKVSSRIDRRKAIILLDELPKILLEKGLKSSEDVRNAILSLDDEYSQLCEQKGILESAFESLKGKNKNVEHALYSLKTIAQYKMMPKYNSDDYSNKEDFEIGTIDQYASNR